MPYFPPVLSPCLWYASAASEAFERYKAAFPGAEVTRDNGFLVESTLGRSVISGMNGGPGYRPNASLSVYAELPAAAAVEAAYARLTEGKHEVLTPLGAYEWSSAYAWIVDAWGVHWQLICVPDARPRLSAALMFAGTQAGKAAEALALYGSAFAKTAVLSEAYHPESAGADAGRLKHAELQMAGGKLVLFDAHGSAGVRDAKFTEGGSLMVACDTQAEIDRYWKALTAGGGQPGRCGWCKDRFGVSWQIIPRQLADWLSNPRTARRVGARMQAMGKLVIAELAPAPARGLI